MTDSGGLERLHNRPGETEFDAHEKGGDRPRFPVPPDRAHRPVIHEENRWRRPDILESRGQGKPGVVVSRWRGMDLDAHSFEIAGDYHILAIALRPTEFSLQLGARLFPRQEVVPGMIQITPPGLAARVVHSQPYDMLHLHIPNLLLMECFERSRGKWPTDGIALQDPLPARDALLQELAPRWYRSPRIQTVACSPIT